MRGGGWVPAGGGGGGFDTVCGCEGDGLSHGRGGAAENRPSFSNQSCQQKQNRMDKGAGASCGGRMMEEGKILR